VPQSPPPLQQPASQLGGRDAVENVRRVRAAEHFVIPVQLARFKLTHLTPPAPPAFPYGHREFVRLIGPPDGRSSPAEREFLQSRSMR
jgi:hypothetical protein